MDSVLVDASFLVALGYPRDNNHAGAKQFSEQEGTSLLLPDVVLPEAMYNLRRVGGRQAALRFGDLLVAQATPFLPLTVPDFVRAMEVMRTYIDADLDLVDCCITALAERMNITQICTFDRRDFSMIRPRHTDYFELLP
jgi:predicted nucleic acid-binding protein